jgi:hypothetical protein
LPLANTLSYAVVRAEVKYLDDYDKNFLIPQQ